MREALASKFIKGGLTMHNYFYCYSIKLKDWLKLSGLQYNQKIKTKSGKYCWLFERGKELDAALSGWEKYKQIFN